MILAIGLWTFLPTLVTGSAAVALENLALRHQLLVLQRSVRRPRLARRNRIPLCLKRLVKSKVRWSYQRPRSSSCGRTTDGRGPCSRCEVWHPSLRAVSGE